MYDTDVAVVGLGPVGALLALLLGRQEMQVVALDRREEIYPLPRAVSADEEVQRMLCGAGLGDAVREMLPMAGARFLDGRGRRLLEVEMPGTGTGHSGYALFRQPELERTLRGHVAAQPTVHTVLGRGGTVVAVEQDETAVDLHLGDGSRLRSRYVVGCDGASSPVRGMLGIPFMGGSFRQRWLVVDALHGPREGGRQWVQFRCDRVQPAAVVPGRFGTRVELLVPNAGAPIGQAEAVRRTAPYLPLDASVERVATYVFADRSARRWREGRVLLAGDAAHTMPPFAGQGFAAGVRDVTNLAWKLDLVVRGLATPGLLDTYEAERRAHLSAMTRLTRLAGSLVTPTGPVPATLRDAALRATGRLPWLGPLLREGRLKPPQRLPKGAAPPLVPGSRGGGPLVRSPLLPTGAGQRRLDALRGTGFALLGVGVDPLAFADADTRAVWERVGVTSLTLPASVLTHAAEGEVVIVRPDHFLLDTVPAARLAEATVAYFGDVPLGLRGAHS